MTDYYVATTGNNGDNGGISDPWLTIIYALDQIIPGDIIYIRGGTYNERLYITQGQVGQDYLTIKAYPDETPVIQPQVESTGWEDIGGGRWRISVSSDDYDFNVTNNGTLFYPVLIKENDYGISRVNTVDELENPIIDVVNPSTGNTEYDLFFSEDKGDTIEITLSLIRGENPNTEINIFILDPLDRITIYSPNIEINGLTFRYGYDGIYCANSGGSFGDNVRIINNTIERIANFGISEIEDNAYIYNNIIRYCGQPLKYDNSPDDPSNWNMVQNNLDPCIYSTGTNGIIDSNTLGFCYGTELQVANLASALAPGAKPYNYVIKNNFVVGKFILSGGGNVIYNNIVVANNLGTPPTYAFISRAPYSSQVYNNLFIGNYGVWIKTDNNNEEYLEFRNNIIKNLVFVNHALVSELESRNHKFNNNLWYGSSTFSVDGTTYNTFVDYKNYMNSIGLEKGTINDEPLFIREQDIPEDYLATDYMPLFNSPVIDAGFIEDGKDLDLRNPSIIYYNPYSLGETDYNGQNRIVGDIVDMGPFEYQQNPSEEEPSFFILPISSNSSSSSFSSSSISSSSVSSSSSSSSSLSSSSSSLSSSSISSSSSSLSSSSISSSSSSISSSSSSLSSSSISSSSSSLSSSSSSLSSSSSSISSSSSLSSSSSSTSIYTDINNGDIVTVSENIIFRFLSVNSNTATIIIDGINFVIKNENGLFVWDNNSKINKNIFTWTDQKIYRKAGRFFIKITYNGEGSLLFSIEFVTFYKMTADLISDSQDRGENISSEILQMRNDLDNSEIDDENIDKLWLYNEINRTYIEINRQHNNYSSETLNFVQKLQKYIVDKYGSINSFLRDNNLTVLPTFAAISSLVGYTIDDDLIIPEEELCPIS